MTKVRLSGSAEKVRERNHRYTRLMSENPWPQTCIDPLSESDQLEHVRFCSPFAAGLINRHPEWLEQLQADRLDHSSPPHPMRAREWVLSRGLEDGLRNFRNQEMLRIIWRDLSGLASLGETFTDLSSLAETCLELALENHHQELCDRFGQPRSEDGILQEAVVLGVGKLGGHELNLSSDIDLIFCFPAVGRCDGPRGRSNDEFFSSLSRKVIGTLSSVRPTGFCFRVDTRLRPFGRVGPIASSFSAMEQYYQREGRNWERYALVKARPVAGDIDAGHRLLQVLKPFVYRRYIDFGAIEALQEMQSLIRAETERSDRRDDIKRGRGGIREIEFLAQGFQLLRGGRNTRLQTPSLAHALAGITSLGLLPADVVERLRSHYASLRHIENRLQAMQDQQTHVIPGSEAMPRLLRGMNIRGEEQFRQQLGQVQGEVSRIFDDTWSADSSNDSETALEQDWQQQWVRWRSGSPDREVEEAGRLSGQVQSFIRGLARRPLGHVAGQRLDRFMPLLLQKIEAHDLPRSTVDRLLDLVTAVTQRSAYLSLLTENPGALDRTVELFSASRWVARQVVRFPELLDDLIDPALGHHIPDRAMLDEAVARKLRLADEEAALIGLNYLKQANCLKLAVAWLEDRIDEAELHRALTHLAESMIQAALQMAQNELVQRHGVISNSSVAVIGYGSLGSGELGFNSDLDLVFLYQSDDGESDGNRPLAAERWFARLAQRMVALLTALTPSGKLYEIDTRLRPNGQSGLLVSSIKAFRIYQENEAWTWEAQALTRARGVAGDQALVGIFEEIRMDNLCRRRDPKKLGRELVEMRERIRDAHGDGSESDSQHKHGPGGMIDIGFIAQLGVLQTACEFRSVARHQTVSAQLEKLHEANWIDSTQLELLQRRLAALRRARFERELEAGDPGSRRRDERREGEAVSELFARLAGSVE